MTSHLRRSSPALWQRARAVLEQCFDVAAEERSEFARARCASEPELLREVLELLEADAAEGRPLEPPAVAELFASGGGSAAPARRIGPWEVERLLGSGGMGTVWLARRADRQYERRVALKLMRLGAESEEGLRRFDLERRVLATLEHPGIVRLYDGGVAEDGQPYLVIEYVEGRPIDRHCEERALSVRARIELFLEACAAVEYAHGLGIVHRDLKPHNLLVTGGGRPKLLDFGIAKLVEPQGDLAHGRTATNLRRMTPEYASPEQIRGDPVTAASDVHALGVILYELLCGERPHASATLLPAELERAICENVPAPPSRVVPQRGPAPTTCGIDARELRRILAGDLDAIVLNALRKEPRERYASVSELAADLRRYLAGLPVTARATTWVYRTRKFVHRNRTLTAATATTVLALAIGLSASLRMYSHAEDARAAEARQRARAEDERAAAEQRTYVASLAAAESALRSRDVADARRRLDEAPEALRGWEWRHLERRTDTSFARLRGHASWVHAVAASPDGRLLASGGTEREVRLWDAALGRLAGTWSGLPRQVEALAFDPRGGALYALAFGHSVRVFDLERGLESLPALAAETMPEVLACDRSGGRLLTGHRDGTLRLWDAGERRAIALWSQGFARTTAIAWHPSGAGFVAADVEGALRRFEIGCAAPVEVLQERGPAIVALDFDAGGTRLVTASTQDVRVFDLDGKQPPRHLIGHGERVQTARFSPDGRTIATGSWDQSVMLWDAASGEPSGLLLGHREEVMSLAFLDDRRLATCSNDTDVRLWDVGAEQVSCLRSRVAYAHRCALSPDGRLLAGPAGPCPGGDRTVRVWNARDGAPLATFPPQGDVVTEVAFSPDGARLAAAGADGTVRITRVADGALELALAPRGARFWSLAFSLDGGRLAVGDEDGTLSIFDAATGAGIAIWKGHLLRVWSLAFSPDGERLLSASKDGSAKLWRTRDGSLERELPGIRGQVWTAVFDSAGERIATGEYDGTIRIFDASRGSALATLSGHTSRVQALAFSPDGVRLASGSADQTVRIWDARRWLEVATLHGHEYHVYWVAFSPDGTRLHSAGADCTVRVWEAPPGR